MKYVCRTARKNGVGETSSKYGYPGGGEQFERDIAKKFEEAESLYQDFVKWMLERQVDPETMRRMILRFYEEYIKGE